MLKRPPDSHDKLTRQYKNLLTEQNVHLNESALNLSNVNSGIETLTNVHDYVSLQHLRK